MWMIIGRMSVCDRTAKNRESAIWRGHTDDACHLVLVVRREFWHHEELGGQLRVVLREGHPLQIIIHLLVVPRGCRGWQQNSTQSHCLTVSRCFRRRIFIISVFPSINTRTFGTQMGFELGSRPAMWYALQSRALTGTWLCCRHDDDHYHLTSFAYFVSLFWVSMLPASTVLVASFSPVSKIPMNPFLGFFEKWMGKCMRKGRLLYRY